jgi:glucans biosynthesis protein
VIATRVGRERHPGQPRPRTRRRSSSISPAAARGSQKGDPVQLIVDAARGTIDGDYVLQVVGTKHWRAFFDIAVDGAAPVDIRAFLRYNDKPLSETWLFQFIPFDY